jgi:hypothetical protein
MSQQTAVEWLVEKIEGTDSKIARVIGLKKYNEIVQQAKAIEKEQILNACYQFSDYPFNKEDHLEYYNETYNK